MIESTVIKFATGVCINGIRYKKRIIVPFLAFVGSSAHDLKKNFQEAEIFLLPSKLSRNVHLSYEKTITSERLKHALTLVSYRDNLRVSINANESATGADAIAMLSKFIILSIRDFDDVTSEALTNSSLKMNLGQSVNIIGVPFGNDCNGLFQFMTWRGFICGSVGDGSDIFIVDTKSLPTIEGCVVVTEDDCVIGYVIACLEARGGCTSGLVLIGHINIVLDLLTALSETTLPISVYQVLPYWVSPASSVTVYVNALGSWGSGVILKKKYIITCAHILDFSNTKLPNVFFRNQPVQVKRSLFVAERNSVFDIAIFEIANKIADDIEVCNDVSIGDACFVLGHGSFPRHISSKPLLTQGNVTNINRMNGEMLMIQTDCLVNGGCSGAGVYKKETGALIAVVVSNLSDENNIYPSANFCIPISHVKAAVDGYDQTGDLNLLRRLGRMPKAFHRLWLEAFDSIPRSKL